MSYKTAINIKLALEGLEAVKLSLNLLMDMGIQNRLDEEGEVELIEILASISEVLDKIQAFINSKQN